MKRKAWFFSKNSTGSPYNTYIGGVAAQITSASDLATRLGITAGDISNFENHTGNDVRCKINISYTMPLRAFSNSAGQFPYDVMTHYVDYGGNCTGLESSGYQFFDQGFMDFLFFPNLVTGIYGTQAMRLLSVVTIIYLYGTFTDFGDTTGYDTVISQVNRPILTLYCPRYFETNNGGAPDGDVSFNTNLGMTAIYLDNATIPAAVQTKLNAII